MNRIATYINRYIDGVAYSSPDILSAHATDRSVLKYHPRIVAFPHNTKDISRLLRFSFQLSKKGIDLPITPQGAMRSKTGSSLGSGLVISTQKLDRILELDTRQRLVRVQPGVTYRTLRNALLCQGLDLPLVADDSETIGGIIARGARGSINSESLDIAEIVQKLEFVMYDGTVVESNEINLTKLKKQKHLKPSEKKLYEQLAKLLRSMPDKTDAHDHRGYYGIAGQSLKKFNIAKLLCGSEGTLGVISEVILRCEALYEEPEYVAILCRNNAKLTQTAELLKKLKFSDVTCYDAEFFNAKASTGKDSAFFRSAPDDAFLLTATVKDDAKRQRRRKLKKLRKQLPKDLKLIRSTEVGAEEFSVLPAKLSAYFNDDAAVRHLPLADDVYIPPAQQKHFLDGVNYLSESKQLSLAVLAKLDHNLFTIRPTFNVASASDRRRMIDFLRNYVELIDGVGGSPCGNASEGRFLALFTNSHRDTSRLQFDTEIKQIFDPAGLLNPDLKQSADAKSTLRHFRTSHDTGLSSID